MIHQLTPWAASAAFVLMATLAIYVWCWREKLNKALEEEDATDRVADTLIAKYEEEKRRNAKKAQLKAEEDRIRNEALEEDLKKRLKDSESNPFAPPPPLTEDIDYAYRGAGPAYPYSPTRFFIPTSPEPFALEEIDLFITPALSEEAEPHTYVSFGVGYSQHIRHTRLLALFDRIGRGHYRRKFNNKIRISAQECWFEINRDWGNKDFEIEILLKGTLTRSRP